jgi:hypothetical protein
MKKKGRLPKENDNHNAPKIKGEKLKYEKLKYYC